jgi:serine/threonine protein kinase
MPQHESGALAALGPVDKEGYCLPPFVVGEDLIDERYYTDRLLYANRDSLSFVYLATDEGNEGREVAVKLRGIPDEATWMAAQREKGIHASMGEGRGIAPLVAGGDIHTSHGLHSILVTPYMPTGTLKQYNKQNELPNLALLRRTLTDVGAGVARADEKGVLHGDLKPANITMPGVFAGAKLIDWGGAKIKDTRCFVPELGKKALDKAIHEGLTGQAASGATQEIYIPGSTPSAKPTTYCFTLDYASPEVLQGHKMTVGMPSEVFALATILHEAVAKRLPYDSSDAGAKLRAFAGSIPMNLCDIMPFVPPEWGEVTQASLSPGPANRPSLPEFIGAIANN